jgi:toxin ParE1/3/4
VTSIIKSPQYEADLAVIWGHIAVDSEVAADRVIAAIEDTIELLQSFPGIGAPCPHLAPGLRRTMWRRYLIYYRVRGQSVELVRVLHGSRDITERMFEQ